MLARWRLTTPPSPHPIKDGCDVTTNWPEVIFFRKARVPGSGFYASGALFSFCVRSSRLRPANMSRKWLSKLSPTTGALDDDDGRCKTPSPALTVSVPETSGCWMVMRAEETVPVTKSQGKVSVPYTSGRWMAWERSSDSVWSFRKSVSVPYRCWMMAWSALARAEGDWFVSVPYTSGCWMMVSLF